VTEPFVLNIPGQADDQATAPASAWPEFHGRHAQGSQRLALPYKPRPGQKLTVWPSGDFSLGYLPAERRQDDNPFANIGADWGVIAWLGRLREPVAGWMSLEQLLTLLNVFEQAQSHSLALKTAHAINRQVASETMGLSVPTNSHNSGPQRIIRRGLKGITSRQRRQVKSAGVLLEKKYGRENLSFLTLTLPADSEGNLVSWNSNFGEITRQTVQELRRELIRQGLPGEIIGVVEIQEGRLERLGELALHLHLIFAGRKNAWSPWAIDKVWIRDLWNRQLEMVVGMPFFGDATTRIEKPRKSLQKELGKYLSKGARVIARVVDLGLQDQLPHFWVTVSLTLRRLVNSNIVAIVGKEVTNIWDRRRQLESLGIIRFREILIPPDKSRGRPKEQVVGIAGYLLCCVADLPLFEDLAALDLWIEGQALPAKVA
jgi:hypothetical protein